MRMPTLSIATRFNGPPDSANGGYTAGLIASALGARTSADAGSGASVSVRLHRPIPLQRALTLVECENDAWEVRDGEALIAMARPTRVDIDVPKAPSYTEALAASAHYAGFERHALPTCFVCGTARRRHDGLCIYAGAVGDSCVLAAPWMPDETLDDGAGKVRPEFIWAALDCPGYFATAHPQFALLGELAVHVDRLVHIHEPCVVVAWPIAREGRKHRAGTALFDEHGERCAAGVATWIEIKT